MPGNFFDTNVLIYVASSDQQKAEKAEMLLAEGGTISVQVLNEMANVARRKMRLSWTETRAFLGAVRGLLDIVPVTAETHETGVLLGEQYGLSVYDAMIVSAALLANCSTLYSEDMQHGLFVEKSLHIVNPFAL